MAIFSFLCHLFAHECEIEPEYDYIFLFDLYTRILLQTLQCQIPPISVTQALIFFLQRCCHLKGSSLLHVVKLFLDVVDLRVHNLTLVFIVAYLILEAHFESDPVCKDEERQLLIEVVTHYG